MTTLYFLRHGETAWNLKGNRYCGRTDIPLSETGYRQASQAANALRGIDFAAVYSSPLRRSRETADVIAGAHEWPRHIDDRLIEIDFGQWEGKTPAEIEETDPEGWSRWRGAPERTAAGHSGETAMQVYDRASACVDGLRQSFSSESLLIVGHNTLNRIYIAGSLGMPLRNYRQILQRNTGISVLRIEQSSWQWLTINESCHLSGLDKL